MASKRRLIQACSALSLLSAAGLFYELWRSEELRQYNVAVAQGHWAAAAGRHTPWRDFAAAYQLHQQGESQRALQAYGAIANTTEDPKLLSAVQFNMGNLYLQRALGVDRKSEGDLALPLVELAKETYRELLRRDPQHWDAKYNLERTLSLFPDVKDQPAQEFNAPEHGPRALLPLEVERELP